MLNLIKNCVFSLDQFAARKGGGTLIPFFRSANVYKALLFFGFMHPILTLARPHQWYKNLVVYLPLLFVGALLDFNKIILASIGFLALCLLSSANYVINDIRDREKDRAHPEKKHRPLASGTVSLPAALTLVFALLLSSVLIGYTLGYPFLGILLALFLSTTLYSFFIKHILFADVLLIATNFVLRAVAGAISINVVSSPWLVLCTFFLSLFLSIGKRHSDALFLKEDAKKHKALLQYYTPEITQSLLIITTTALLMAYSLYSFANNHNLLLTIPFSLYVLFRYFYFIITGSIIARHPEKIVRDIPILIGILAWIGITLGVLYF